MSPPSAAEPSPVLSPADVANVARAEARRGLLWFGLGVAAASAVVEALLLRAGEPLERQAGLVFALMWAPGLVSALVRLARREGFADVSFRMGGAHGRRALAVAWLFPVAACALAYGVAWGVGVERFTAPPGLTAAMSPAAALAASVALNLVQGTVFGAVAAAGEEIGWRGYMLTRLVDAGVRRPVLVSGAVCALWHLPLVASGQYAAGPSRALSALSFCAVVVAHAYVLAKLRLSSGSVWPAVVFHASWNAQLQGAFEPFARGAFGAPVSSVWAGESGLLVAAAAAAFALLYVRRAWPVRHFAAERPARWLGPGDA